GPERRRERAVDEGPDDEDGDRRPEAQAEQDRDPRQRARLRAADHDGGRNPNVARIAWPSGPASQVRNAPAAAAFVEAFTTTPAYVAGTFAAAGTASVVTFEEAFASVW